MAGKGKSFPGNQKGGLLANLEAALNNPKRLVQLPDGDDMWDKMKCVACKRYPLLPRNSMSFCSEGHMFCFTCAETFGSSKSKGCPKLLEVEGDSETCKKDVVTMDCNESHPLISYFLDHSMFICPFKGCGSFILGSEMENHVAVCTRRYSFPCISQKCGQFAHYNSIGMWHHLLKSHDDVVTNMGLPYVRIPFEHTFKILCVKEDRWDAKMAKVNPLFRRKRNIISAMKIIDDVFVICFEDLKDKVVFFVQMLNMKSATLGWHFFVNNGYNCDLNEPWEFKGKIFGYDTNLRTENFGNLKHAHTVVVVEKSLLRKERNPNPSFSVDIADMEKFTVRVHFTCDHLNDNDDDE